jgi:large subunit ribosomal protein L30
MAKAKKTEPGKIKVTLVKSTIACIPQHKKIVEALGLKKIRSYKIHEANASIMGMINKVSYLVKVENV